MMQTVLHNARFWQGERQVHKCSLEFGHVTSSSEQADSHQGRQADSNFTLVSPQVSLL